MNDREELQTHINLVRQLSKPGGPLALDSPYSTIRNKEFSHGNGSPRPARRRLHEQLRDATLENATATRHAILISGPPGAGKSTVIASRLQSGRQRSYAHIDSDEYKTALLNHSLKDGTYDTHIKPPEIHQLEQQGHRFFPLELASLVHTESTRIATNTFTHAIKAGLDVIIDSVGANEKSIHSRLIALQEAGYTVELIDVECPHKVSEKAIFQQWSQGRKKSLQSPDAPLDLGEHWVPSVTLDPLFPSKGPSVPEAVTKCLAAEFTNIIAYQLWRRTNAAQAPSLEADLIQIINGSTLANRAETQTSRTIFKACPHRHTKGTAVG